MARMILIFIMMWATVAAIVVALQSMSGKQKWQLVKTLTFSGVCAIIAFVLLMALVVIF